MDESHPGVLVLRHARELFEPVLGRRRAYRKLVDVEVRQA